MEGQRLVEKSSELTVMASLVDVSKHPLIKEIAPKAMALINKTGGRWNTEFMDSYMVIRERPTPLGQLRQCAAEMNAAQMALFESKFKMKEVELEYKAHEAMLNHPDELTREANAIQIQKIDEGRILTRHIVEAAISRYNFLCSEFKRICDENEIDSSELTHSMIEANQPKEQLLTCYQQAIRSAMSNGGVPGEGDYMFSDEIGVSVFEIYWDIKDFVTDPVTKDARRDVPKAEVTKWLESIWEKYKDRYANWNKR